MTNQKTSLSLCITLKLYYIMDVLFDINLKEERKIIIIDEFFQYFIY